LGRGGGRGKKAIKGLLGEMETFVSDGRGCGWDNSWDTELLPFWELLGLAPSDNGIDAL